MKWRVAFNKLLRPISPTKNTVANQSQSPSSRQGFTRGNTKSNQNLKAQYNGGQSPVTQQAPPLPPLSNSPSISSTFSQENVYNEQEPKKFLNEKWAKCSVKGNFLTLAAQPKNVELGEWLAHQRELTILQVCSDEANLIEIVVEMNRLLTGMIQVIQEVDTNTGLPLCNEIQCSTMSAGR